MNPTRSSGRRAAVPSGRGSAGCNAAQPVRPLLLGLLLAGAPGLPGSALAADGAFELGTVEVVASPAAAPESGASVLRSADLERYNRDTVGQAVALVPGMSVTHNGRNEDIVFLRGFDVRQVPLFQDGVPLYVPYDGYVDFGRFTTYDLSQVQVAKGAASLLYGPNALGGAINLVTRKPTKAFEGDIQVGFASGHEQKATVNLGGSQGFWYYQIGASYLDADYFPLSHDYTPRKVPTSKTNPTPVAVEEGGARDNSYRTDRKLSVKIGFTPNAGDEYAIGYTRQEGVKGNPPYAGNAPGNTAATTRFWQWPYWDVDSLYFVARVTAGDRNLFRFRAYDDSYRNSIHAFTNGSYATQLYNTSFPSAYDDATRGASIEWVNFALADHELHVAYHYKEDRHKETNPLSPDHDFRDVTTSLAVEDDIALAPGWRLRLGASHDEREGREAYHFATGTASKDNWLAEISHDLASGGEAYASLARKSRFPTIKDRYSYKLGTAMPNPDLRPETALNAEIGIKGSPWAGGRGQAAVFVSRIDDLMQNVVVAAPDVCASGPTPNVTCNQLQNIGEARHAGVEVAIEQQFAARWQGGINYTYLVRTNLTNAAIPLIDTPRHRIFAHLGWQAADAWEFQATLDAEQDRKTAYGSGYETLGGYTVLGAKAVWTPRPDTTVEVGVRNLTDEDYELADGYPMPGRTWFANARYRF